MSQKKNKQPKKLSINTKDFLAGTQALNIFYEEKVATLESLKNQLGEDHPAYFTLLEEIDNLANILNFFSSMVNGQVNGEGEHLN